MAIKRYSKTEKEQILKEVADVGKISPVAKKHGIPTTTLYTWSKKSKNAPVLEKDTSIQKLKQALADKELENNILRELLKKTSLAWLGK